MAEIGWNFPNFSKTDFRFEFSTKNYILGGIFYFWAPFFKIIKNSAFLAKNGWKWLKFSELSKSDFRFGFSAENYILGGLFLFRTPFFKIFKKWAIFSQKWQKVAEILRIFKKCLQIRIQRRKLYTRCSFHVQNSIL